MYLSIDRIRPSRLVMSGYAHKGMTGWFGICRDMDTRVYRKGLGPKDGAGLAPLDLLSESLVRCIESGEGARETDRGRERERERARERERDREK